MGCLNFELLVLRLRALILDVGLVFSCGLLCELYASRLEQAEESVRMESIKGTAHVRCFGVKVRLNINRKPVTTVYVQKDAGVRSGRRSRRRS